MPYAYKLSTLSCHTYCMPSHLTIFLSYCRSVVSRTWTSLLTKPHHWPHHLIISIYFDPFITHFFLYIHPPISSLPLTFIIHKTLLHFPSLLHSLIHTYTLHTNIYIHTMCPTDRTTIASTRKPGLRSAFEVLDVDHDGKIDLRKNNLPFISIHNHDFQ